MQVQGQELADTEIAEFLELVKAALESWEASGLSRRSLSRRSPFAEEWVVLMSAGRRLFGMPDQESGSPS